MHPSGWFTKKTSRRNVLAGLAASPFVTTGIGVFSKGAKAQAAAAGLISPNVCMLSPEVTEGPYYLDENLLRQDITEGKPGIPMQMRMQVVTADCNAVEGARVDIWHCDALGNYSGYASQGSDTTTDTQAETFLRGTQMTDAAGLVAFDTIYPGWYRGRTTHIHCKVFLDERTVLTSQIFFPDALSAYLFENIAPYNDRPGNRDTFNRTDGIAQQAGDGAYAAIREQSERYTADLVIGINPEADSAESGPGGMRPPEGGTGGRPPGPPPSSNAGSEGERPRLVPGQEG